MINNLEKTPNTKKEFIIKFKTDPNLKKNLIWLIPIMLIGSLMFFNISYYLLFLPLSFELKNITIISFLWFLFKIIISLAMGLVAFTGLVMPYLFYSNYKNNVILRANENGIWAKYHNFIPWEYIDSVEEYSPSYSPMAPTQVAIWIKTNKEIRKHLSLGTKMGIFWSKITGYQPITTGGMDSFENLKFIKFANQYIEKN